MNNKEVCRYIEAFDEHKNQDGAEYVADICVKEGIGQTKGGYLDGRFPVAAEKAEPSQKKHFTEYYGDIKRNDKTPSYNSLWCPQLMLFIAEVSGVPRKRLEEAYEILYRYEKENNLIGTEKGACYIRSKQVLKEFKDKIMIAEVNKIIKKSDNWDAVIDECKKLSVR